MIEMKKRERVRKRDVWIQRREKEREMEKRR